MELSEDEQWVYDMEKSCTIPKKWWLLKFMKTELQYFISKLSLEEDVVHQQLKIMVPTNIAINSLCRLAAG